MSGDGLLTALQVATLIHGGGGSLAVTVDNVAPTIALTGAASVNEKLTAPRLGLG